MPGPPGPGDRSGLSVGRALVTDTSKPALCAALDPSGVTTGDMDVDRAHMKKWVNQVTSETERDRD